MLYELVAGAKPFRGSSPVVVINAILNQQPDRLASYLSSAPGAVERVIDRALEKDRSLRYQTAAELRADIDRIRIGREPDVAPRIRTHRRRWAKAAAGVVLVGLALVGTWVVIPKRGLAEPPRSLEPTLQQLTFNSPELPVTSTAISPDAKYVAYGDGGGIHVMVVQTGETQILANTAGMGVDGWMPDSTTVLASRPSSQLDEPPTLVRLSVLGSSIETGTNPNVSPDGKHRFKLDMRPFSQSEEVRVDVRLSDAQSGNWHTVATLTDMPPEVHWVDNVHLAIWVDINQSIETMDVRDGTRKVIVREGALPRLFPGGIGRIVYQQCTDNRMSTSGRSTRNTSSASPQRLTFNERDDVLLEWSADSREVVFGSDSKIYRQGLGERTPRMLIGSAASGPGAILRSVGSLGFVYMAATAGGPKIDLMLAPPEGGIGQKLIEARLFDGLDCGAFGCIWAEPMPYFGTGRPKTEFKFIDVEHRTVRPMFQRDFEGLSSLTFTVSPDGKKIAALVFDCRTCPSETSIAVRVTTLSDVTIQEIPIREHSSPDVQPVWAIGREGFLLTTREGVVLLEPPGKERMLWKGPAVAVRPSPDGKHLALGVMTTDSNLWLVRRPGPEH